MSSLGDLQLTTPIVLSRTGGVLLCTIKMRVWRNFPTVRHTYYLCTNGEGDLEAQSPLFTRSGLLGRQNRGFYTPL